MTIFKNYIEGIYKPNPPLKNSRFFNVHFTYTILMEGQQIPQNFFEKVRPQWNDASVLLRTANSVPLISEKPPVTYRQKMT